MAISFADFCAGIGGFHLAMSAVGGKCIYASEIDLHARTTYLANFPTVKPVFDNDLTQLEAGILPDFDVMCAGFPCQPFSSSGSKIGFDDDRGNIFSELMRIVRGKKQRGSPPKVLILENVRNLIHHDNGRTIAVIKQSLSDLGYSFKIGILNSLFFGLPQDRTRVYIVAWLPELGHSFLFPSQDYTWKLRVGDLLEEGVPDKFTLKESQWSYCQRRREFNASKGNGFEAYRLFNHNSHHLNTLTTRSRLAGGCTLIEQEDRLPRILTPREYARFQGFPDSFVILVSDTQAFKQFGNAVSIPVATEVVIEVGRQLFNGN